MIAHLAARVPAHAAVLLIALALATAAQQVSAAATSSCAADGSGCGAGGEEDASLLSLKISRHEVPSVAQGGPPVEGRCCYGLDTCPSQMGANDHIKGCKAASDHCSKSQHACEKKACCARGPFGKKHPKFCPVTAPPTQSCALGDDVRVVTDMGFDDWGAFSVLNAAGCTPQKALGVEGMMPSNFTGNFSKLLRSWGLSTQVYQGPVETTCYGGLECPFNTSSVSWLSRDYRPSIYEALPGALNPEWDGDASVVDSIDEFWACESGKKYTLLVISPATAVAEQLFGSEASKYTSCISEIVYMGGMFDSEQLAQTDPGTAANADGPRWNVSYYDNVSLLSETNVVSDALASQKMWGDDELGIKQSIFSLETASCNRAGVQRILFAGQTAMYDGEMQEAQQALAQNEAMLDSAANCDSETGPTSMLAKMVCIHDSCNRATLDFDAIAATYVWLGKEDKVNIQLEQSSVVVDTYTAVTTRTLDDSSSRWVATTFNAIWWYSLLGAKLTAR